MVNAALTTAAARRPCRPTASTWGDLAVPVATSR
jgi:hypothetical protein